MTFRHRPVLALIPARGGSKGVLRKNLRLVRGSPLVAHAIRAGIESTVVDTVYVSSDDEEILEVAHSLGVQALKRPAHAATDAATAADVVTDFIAQLPADVRQLDPYLVYLQPTSPLRTGAHVDAAFAEMNMRNGEVGLSVVRLAKTPYKSFTLDQHGLLQSLFEERLSNANRQELPAAYYPNGAIYMFPIGEFIRLGRFPVNGGVPFMMSEADSLDIDSEDDIAVAEKR